MKSFTQQIPAPGFTMEILVRRKRAICTIGSSPSKVNKHPRHGLTQLFGHTSIVLLILGKKVHYTQTKLFYDTATLKIQYFHYIYIQATILIFLSSW